jgi:hypothetical protein
VDGRWQLLVDEKAKFWAFEDKVWKDRGKGRFSLRRDKETKMVYLIMSSDSVGMQGVGGWGSRERVSTWGITEWRCDGGGHVGG